MTTERDAEASEEDEGARRLVIDADFPSQWFDLEALIAKTICQAAVFRRECSSTNDLAGRLVAGAVPRPLLVLPVCHPGGRALGGNTCLSL